jgi:cell division protein FtsQ
MPASTDRAARAPRRAFPVLALAAAAFVVVGSGVGAYFLARQTSVFALKQIEVQGASPEVAARVRTALTPFVGKSLVQFDAAAAEHRLSEIAQLAGFHFDRAFPHTLRVRVTQERPVAVVRRGMDAWLVAASARVLTKLVARPYPALPRIWISPTTDVAVNSTLGGVAAKAVRVAAPLAPLGLATGVRAVRANDYELTLIFGGGRELRLGDTGDLRLKLAIARRVLPLTTDAAYVDVSVPERTVAGYNPQPEG